MISPFVLFGKPKTGEGSGSGISCNLGISGDFSSYTPGASYSSTVSITGGTAPYTVELITDTTPGAGGTTGPGEPPSGTLLGGYVGAPYVVIGQFGEGISFEEPNPGNYWTITRSSGMPDNVTVTEGSIFVGTPTQAGTFNWSIQANQWGQSPVTKTGTMSILASPTKTIWNAADRQVTYDTVRFLSTSPPFLAIRGFPVENPQGAGGYVRALNGYTTGKKYWQVRVDSIPVLAGEAISIGIDRSRNGNPSNLFGGNSQWIGQDATSGEWGYVMRVLSGGAVQCYTTGKESVGKQAPALVAGDVIEIFHDADADRAWVGIVGKGWFGGGNPILGTLPTFYTLPADSNARWPDYRPLVIIRGENSRITANFGDQAWTGTPPATATTIPFASQPTFTHQVFDMDTATFDSGTQIGGVQISAPTSYTEDVQARGVTASTRLLSFVANPHSVRGSLPKSSGKWLVEFELSGWADRTTVGLVPSTWDTSTLPRPGWTTDSFGVTRGADLVGNTAGVIRNANVDVGTIAASQQPLVITLACDFDASPKTVAVYRTGVLVGTYNLPTSAQPWVPVVAMAANGFVTMRSRGIVYPVAGFTPWNPLGTN
jgi:hypothetical protein